MVKTNRVLEISFETLEKLLPGDVEIHAVRVEHDALRLDVAIHDPNFPPIPDGGFLVHERFGGPHSVCWFPSDGSAGTMQIRD